MSRIRKSIQIESRLLPRALWGKGDLGVDDYREWDFFRGNENVLKVVAMDGQLYEYVKIH